MKLTKEAKAGLLVAAVIVTLAAGRQMGWHARDSSVRGEIGHAVCDVMWLAEKNLVGSVSEATEGCTPEHGYVLVQASHTARAAAKALDELSEEH